MPFEGEHAAPLSLAVGAGAGLKLLAAMIALAGALAWLISPAAPVVRWTMAFASLCLCVMSATRRPGSPRHLLVYPQGDCLLDGRRAGLEAAAWLGPRYAVVRVRRGGRVSPILVSAGRQGPGAFRLLCCWLRQQRFNGLGT